MTQFGNNLPNFLIGSGVDTLIGLGDADSLVSSTAGRNAIFGNQGADSLISQGGADTIYGGQGNDIIRSRGGSLLYGDRGNDTIVGESTSTGIIGGSTAGGGDTMYGGEGDDSLVANSVGPSALFGNQGNDALVAGNRADTLYGGQGNDTLTSTVGGLLYGDRGNDSIVLSGSGVAGATTVYGGDGDDAITGGGRTLLFGNQGSDTITAGAADSVYGGSGADVLTASGSGAFISGDLGNDILRNTGANNTLAGGEGDDTITFDGGAAFSTASGGGGKNFLQILPTITGSGNVLIAGSLGDTLVGAGANTIQGGAGDDSLVSQGSNVTLVGGAGRDTFNVLAGGAISGFNPGEGDTILSGTAPFTIIAGSTGLYLTGTPNRDTLTGGAGNDTLEGLGNADVLTGGAGADVFLFKGVQISDVASVTFNNSTLEVSGTIGAGTAPTAAREVRYFTTFPSIGVPTSFAGASFTFAGGGTLPASGTTGLTSPAFGASLTISYGTSGGIGTSVTPIFGSSFTTGGTLVPLSGYGYALSGFDTITDFDSGVDQIRLEGRLFTSGTNFPNANAPSVFKTVASVTGTNVGGIVGDPSLLFYARDTGILYGRAATAGANTAQAFGSQFLYNPTPVAGTTSLLDVTTGNGTNVLVNSGTAAGALNTVGTALYFILPQTTPITGVAFAGTNTNYLPIPFAQVLKSNAPVTDLTYGRDIVIF
ncbi:beta strand repeat-containing protein [Limnothrix redekei]|uniref:Calcium-binding protein n=1 Tax=Limnothrix redekei LRLZ20PSL1 TaxID=3112953 RepID=A0ABW7CA37_9CYAN